MVNTQLKIETRILMVSAVFLIIKFKVFFQYLQAPSIQITRITGQLKFNITAESFIVHHYLAKHYSIVGLFRS